jgi:hypothetical protein
MRTDEMEKAKTKAVATYNAAADSLMIRRCRFGI